MRDGAADEDLMVAYRNGDAQAFESIYHRHKGPLYRYLLRQCRRAAVAEELFQEVWIGLIRARERYEPRAKFTTYLYRLAHNRLIDHYRRQSSRIPPSYAAEADQVSTEQLAAGTLPDATHELDTRRQVRRLLALIEHLPAAQREAFLLREESGLSLEEIAEATGVNLETAKSRLRYAFAKLRAGMGGTESESDALPDASPREESGSW